MGLIGKLLSFTRNTKNRGAHVTDVKINRGGETNNLTTEHFQDPGVESSPLVGDYIAATSVVGSGRYAALGYVDPKNPPLSKPGEVRVYARGSDGDPVASVWVKNDGSIEITSSNCSVKLQQNGAIRSENASGFFELDGSGNFSTSGNIVSQGSISADSIKTGGKELAGHDHLAGDPPGNTGPNL